MEIIYDILKAMDKGFICYTHIVYKANLGGQMIKRYVIPILESELVIKEGRFYKLSKKGSKALDHGRIFVKLCNIWMKPEGETYLFKTMKRREIKHPRVFSLR